MRGVQQSQRTTPFARLVQERQLYFRSGSSYRSVIIGPRLQLMAWLLLGLCVGGVALLGLGYMSAKDQVAGQAERIAALQEALDGNQDAREAEIERLRGMVADLETISDQQRETITHLTELQATLRKELEATQNEVAAVAQERDAARHGLRDLREGTREQEVVTSGLAAEKVSLAARMAALEARLTTVTSERDLARRSEKGLRWRVDMLETKLTSLRSTAGAETSRLRAWIVSHVSALEGVLERSGLNVDRLIQKVDPRLSSGQGGPLVPALGKELAPPAVPSQPGLAKDLSRLQRIHRLLTAVPLAAPMANYRLTSGFGVRRDPFTGRSAAHEGLDFGGASKARALATAPGRVVEAGHAGAYGIMVEIEHGLGIRTRYAHLSKALVRVGDRVTFHEPVGIMGSTGRSTAEHLHYEIRIDGRPLDPGNFLEAGRRLRHVLER
jgi:murein DD-endopeptidase MepM/ murein hydrolase activator NlpD